MKRREPRWCVVRQRASGVSDVIPRYFKDREEAVKEKIRLEELRENVDYYFSVTVCPEDREKPKIRTASRKAGKMK
jgi:hypothetical protein